MTRAEQVVYVQRRYERRPYSGRGAGGGAVSMMESLQRGPALPETTPAPPSRIVVRAEYECGDIVMFSSIEKSSRIRDATPTSWHFTSCPRGKSARARGGRRNTRAGDAA